MLLVLLLLAITHAIPLPSSPTWTVVKTFADRKNDCVIEGHIPEYPNHRFSVRTNEIWSTVRMTIKRERVPLHQNQRLFTDFILTMIFYVVGESEGRCEEWAKRLESLRTEQTYILNLNRISVMERLSRFPIATDPGKDDCKYPSFIVGTFIQISQEPKAISIDCHDQGPRTSLELKSAHHSCIVSARKAPSVRLCKQLNSLKVALIPSLFR